MTTGSLLLYVDSQFTSPYAMSVFVALHEKELPFRLQTVDLESGDHARPPYARTSVTRRVPTLDHDGFRLAESSAITEYLEDVFQASGRRLYPSDPRERARARQVQAWLRSDLLPLRQERSTEVVFCGKRLAPLSQAASAAVEKLYAAAEALLAPGAEHLCGDWCIADVDLALMLQRLQLHGDAMPERLADYARRQWQRPAIQRWVRQERPPL
jgi:glutathione S-transferase